MANSTESDSCVLYWPGHMVHWIHAKHWWPAPKAPATNIVVRDGLVRFVAEGVEYTRWNHKLDELATLLAVRPAPQVTFNARWRMLAVRLGEDGTSWRPFYLDSEPSACRFAHSEPELYEG